MKWGVRYDTPMPDLSGDEQAVIDLLQNTKRIAMVGASANPDRPSHGVMRFLLSQGYDVVPVTPKPDPIHGIEPVPDLQAAKERFAPDPIDLVDVFRKPEAVPDVVEEAIQVDAPAIWFQLGVVNEEGIEKAIEAGMDVVVDKCPAQEIPRLGIQH